MISKKVKLTDYLVLVRYLNANIKIKSILVIAFSLFAASIDSFVLIQLSSFLDEFSTNSRSTNLLSQFVTQTLQINDLRTPYIIVTIMSLLIIISLISRISINLFIKKIIAQVACAIRRRIFTQILNKSCTWHENNHSSTFISNCTKDAENYVRVFGAILSATTNLILAIVVLISLLFINTVLTILFGSVILFGYVLIVLINRKKILSLGKQAALSHEAFLRNSSNSFSNIRLINLRDNFNEFESIVFRNIIDEEYARNYLMFRGEFPKIFIESIVFLAILTVALYSLVSSNYAFIDFGVVGLLGIAKIISPAQAVFVGYNSLQANYESATRVLPYFLQNEKQDINSIKLDRFDEISLKDVHISYSEDNTVLQGVNLTIKKGQKIGIIGKTGSGKSTLTNCLLGFQPPSKGNVFVNQRDIYKDKLHMRGWMKSVSEVPQSINVFNGSILQNIKFSHDISNINISQLKSALAVAHLTEYINSLPNGIDHILTESASNLSGGQLQRLALARALYHEPCLVVLDEATSALDTTTENIILKKLDNYKSTSFIFIAHRLKCLDICDHVYEIKNKKLIKVR